MKNLFKKSAFALAFALSLVNSQQTQAHIFPRDEDYYEDRPYHHHGIVGGALIGAGRVTDAAVGTAVNTTDAVTGYPYRHRYYEGLREENADLAAENEALREQQYPE